MGLIPGLGRSSGEGSGNLVQKSCLENSMNRGAWRAKSPWGLKEPDTTEQLKNSQGEQVSKELIIVPGTQ